MRDLDTYVPPGGSNDYRVCQKCGHLLAVVNLLDPGLAFPSIAASYEEPRTCPKCGGPVAWQSVPPMRRRIVRAVLLLLLIGGLLLVGLALLVFLSQTFL